MGDAIERKRNSRTEDFSCYITTKGKKMIEENKGKIREILGEIKMESRYGLNYKGCFNTDIPAISKLISLENI